MIIIRRIADPQSVQGDCESKSSPEITPHRRPAHVDYAMLERRIFTSSTRQEPDGRAACSWCSRPARSPAAVIFIADRQAEIPRCGRTNPLFDQVQGRRRQARRRRGKGTRPSENRKKGRWAELKIKTPDEKTLGYVSGKIPKWKLKDADKQTLFELQSEEDGSYKMEQTNKVVAYYLKQKNGGVEVEDGSHTVIRKIASKTARRRFAMRQTKLCS